MPRLGRGWPNPERARRVTVFASVPVDLGTASSAGTSTASGTLRVNAGLTGSTAGTSTVSGTLRVNAGLTGSSAGTSTVSGTLSFNAALAGSSAGASTVSGTLGAAIFLSGGSSAGSSTASGTLGITILLAGSSAGRSGLGLPDLTVHFTGLFTGTAGGVSSASGTLNINWSLEGSAGGHSTALGTLTPDPTYIFEPPIVYTNPGILPSSKGVQRALFKYYGPYPVGRSVLKISGVYVTIDCPDQLTLATATEVYLGGHLYPVTKATANALIAAGYGAGIS